MDVITHYFLINDVFFLISIGITYLFLINDMLTHLRNYSTLFIIKEMFISLVYDVSTLYANLIASDLVCPLFVDTVYGT